MNAEDIIKKHVKKSKIPGISVGLISKTGTKVFNYGEIKKESGIEPTADTLYEIGSMTKTFTAILTAQLQEEVQLSLQDPITKFLPEFEGSEFDEKNITLYHLITHTSGITESTLKNRLSNLFFIIFQRNKKLPLPKRYRDNTPDFLHEVSKMKLKKNPGTTFRYSNTGIGLVGKILERVTNSTYEELVKNRIWDVLDMMDTGINVLETHKDKLATAYSFRNKKTDYWNAPGVESAGSIRSTVSDMLKFLKANLGLSESKLSPVLEYCKSTKIEPKFNPFLKFLGKLLYHVKSSKIGLGWVEFTIGDTTFLAHDGSTEGFSSTMMIDLERKKGVVVLCNRGLVSHIKLGMKLLKN